MKIKQHLQILGLPVKDAVTGFEGTATSVGFDLYGCVQVIVTPPVNKEGKQPDGAWFDIARLKKLSIKPVMNVPEFDFSDATKGGFDKPLMRG